MWSQLSIELRSTLSSNPPPPPPPFPPSVKNLEFTALKGRRISWLDSGSQAKINVDEQQSTQKCHFHQKTKTQSFRFLESTTKSAHINPFTPESDQCQISPAASQEILHHTVRRTWLIMAYSDER